MTSGGNFRLPEHVIARRLGEDYVMLDMQSGTYFGLDAVGARLWDLLSEEHSVAQACAILAAEYEAPLARIEADVDELLAELAVHGLVQRT